MGGVSIICTDDNQEPNDWPSSIPEEEYESYIWKDDWPDRSNDIRLLHFRECEWKDVTEECMRLMEDIWQAHYGDDWKGRTVRMRPPPGPTWIYRQVRVFSGSR